MSNTIKFSLPEKKIIFGANFNPKENKLFITVTDEGPGIPENEQSDLMKNLNADKGSSRIESTGALRAHGGKEEPVYYSHSETSG